MAQPRPDLPMGTVTFLFSDIEDSTGLAHRLDPATFATLLEQHNRLLRAAFADHHGTERGTQGDSFLVVFRDAPSAVAAAVDVQRAIAGATWPDAVPVRVRIGLHTGEGIAGGDDYVGLDVNRAARIASAAHGGQVVISEATRILAQRGLPGGVGIRDAGEHRLRGLEAPEHLYQLVVDGLPAEFPPLRALSVTEAHLPARSTSFVGREADLELLDRLLAEHRLITLVGPGGTGKTSLALELARRAAGRFPEGAWFVSLESIADAELVAPGIVSVLGLRDPSGRPVELRLLENLAPRSLLLVLDNFEHVLGAAPLVARVLDAAPGCRVVVTSRAPLHVSGEQVCPVDPLPLPPESALADPALLAASASVQLLVERARRVRPSFAITRENAAAVAGICAILDGLPLGIELAAARVPLLGPAAVLDRLARQAALPGPGLRDAPARQRTIRDTIAWSYDLLDAPTRLTFARCAVFAGGWQLEEAQVVCAGPDDPNGALVADTLLALVDQSLVTTVERGDAVRFGMLETIGRFAAERLSGGAPDAALPRRHALAYLAVAEALAPELGRSGSAAAVARLEGEADNLRRAVRWSIDTGEAEMAHRLGTALWRYWWGSGSLESGRATMEAILAMPGADVDAPWRMRALEAMGGLYYYSGERDRPVALYHAQLAMAQRLSDRQGEADARFDLLFLEVFGGHMEEGLAAVEEVAAAYRDLGDELGEARCGWARATVLENNGHLGSAHAELERALVRLEELDDLGYAQPVAGTLGSISFRRGDFTGGIAWFLRATTVLERLGDDAGISLSLPLFASAARRLGMHTAALTIHSAYLSLAGRFGVQMPRRLEEAVAALDPGGSWERAAFPLDGPAYDAAIARGRPMSVREAVAFARATFSGLPGPGQDGGLPPG